MKGKKSLLIIIVLLLVVVLGVVGYQTYARYVGSRTGSAPVEVAMWNVMVEGEDVNAGTPTAFTKNVTWEATDNVAGNRIAPAREGSVEITINPNTTEVAINYYISITKPEALNNENITISSVTVGGNALVKETSGDFAGYYKGTIELPGEAGNKTAMTEAEAITATVNISWADLNTDDANAADTVTGKAAATTDLDFVVVTEQKVD